MLWVRIFCGLAWGFFLAKRAKINHAKRAKMKTHNERKKTEAIMKEKAKNLELYCLSAYTHSSPLNTTTNFSRLGTCRSSSALL